MNLRRGKKAGGDFDIHKRRAKKRREIYYCMAVFGIYFDSILEFLIIMLTRRFGNIQIREGITKFSVKLNSASFQGSVTVNWVTK